MPTKGRPVPTHARSLADRWRRVRNVLAPVLAASLAGYFLYNTIQGERGLRAVAQLDRQVADSQGELARLREQREHWERRVNLLRDSGLDRDLLDERARAVLGIVREGDIVILTPPDRPEQYPAVQEKPASGKAGAR